MEIIIIIKQIPTCKTCKFNKHNTCQKVLPIDVTTGYCSLYKPKGDNT